MREILFKGKCVDCGEWVEGCYIRDVSRDNSEELSKFAHRIRPLFPQAFAHPVDPETISQYTGLTDKNGRKIFENDIVTSGSDSTGRKYYSEVCYGEFNCTCCNGVYGWTFAEGYGDIRDYKKYEVVGNIFDNADLLKETVIEDEEPSEYFEQDTKCDLCKYNGECESKIEITKSRDTRNHYIRWFDEYCKLESEESNGTTKI